MNVWVPVVAIRAVGDNGSKLARPVVGTMLVDRTRDRIEDRSLKLALRQAPIAVWATDHDLRFVYAYTRLTVLSAGAARQAIGQTLPQFLGVQDATDASVAHHLAALGGQPQSFRYWFRSHCFDVWIEPVKDEQDQITGCVGVAVDVTEQEHFEQEFLLTQRRFEEAQEVAHIGTFEWDVKRDLVAWSDEMHRIYGITKEGFPVTHEAFLSYVHPGDRRGTETVFLDAIRTLQPFECRHRIVRPDGGVRVVVTRGDVIVGDQNKAVRVVGCCWDATRLADTARHLERSVSLLQAIINATADGLLVVDLDGKVVTYNQRFVTLWGIPQSLARQGDDEALLAYVLDQLEDSEAFLRGVRALYGQPALTSFDTLQFKDGRVVERYSAPQRLGEEIIGRVWSFRDVTERAHAELQANEAIGILAIAAHDVRNPLGGLALQLDRMRQVLARGDVSATVLEDQIATCHRFVARGAKLLSSLLDVAQIGSRQLKLQLGPVDLAELTQEILKRSRIEIDAAGCELTARADTPVIGHWDRDRLDEVITNLVSNALKYGRGKPVEVSVWQTGASGFVRVQDHGIGISAADYERIFHQFERTAATGKGVSLGLWIVRKLVAALGGRVEVTSKIGEGSTFTLELPLDNAKAGHGDRTDRG